MEKINDEGWFSFEPLENLPPSPLIYGPGGLILKRNESTPATEGNGSHAERENGKQRKSRTTNENP